MHPRHFVLHVHEMKSSAAVGNGQGEYAQCTGRLKMANLMNVILSDLTLSFGAFPSITNSNVCLIL